MRARFALAVCCCFSVLNAGVAQPQSAPTVPAPTGTELPAGKTLRLPSPNGKWSLLSPAPSSQADSEKTLFLENRVTHTRSVVARYNRAIRVGWNPEGKAFFLDDELGSNITDAYLFWPPRANPLLVDDLILAQDPEAKNLKADHGYFLIRNWANSATVIAEYCGHISEAPALQFDFLYRITLTSSKNPSVAVRRISRNVRPARPDSPDCLQ